MGPGLVTWLNLILKDRVSNSGGSTLPEPKNRTTLFCFIRVAQHMYLVLFPVLCNTISFLKKHLQIDSRNSSTLVNWKSFEVFILTTSSNIFLRKIVQKLLNFEMKS